eukprot:5601027-Pyramimonas_sp.AAC.2
MIPFVKAAPMVTFKKPIGSVSVSGHKFVGCPTPCGVTITRKWCMEKLSQTIEYLVRPPAPERSKATKMTEKDRKGPRMRVRFTYYYH